MASSGIDQLFQIAVPASNRAEPARATPSVIAPFGEHLGRAGEISGTSDPSGVLPRRDSVAIRREEVADRESQLSSENQYTSSNESSSEDQITSDSYSRSDSTPDDNHAAPSDEVEISEESEILNPDENTEGNPSEQAQAELTLGVKLPTEEVSNADETSADESILASDDEADGDAEQSVGSAKPRTAAAEAEAAKAGQLQQASFDAAEGLVGNVPIEPNANGVQSKEHAEGNDSTSAGPTSTEPHGETPEQTSEEIRSADAEQSLQLSNRQPDQTVRANGEENTASTNLSDEATEKADNADTNSHADGNEHGHRRSREVAEHKSSNANESQTNAQTQTSASEEKLAADAKISAANATAAAVSAVLAEPASDNLSAATTAEHTLDRLAAARSIQPASVTPENERTPTVDRARFVQRVGGALRLASQRDGQVTLRLSPPELGSLRLEIAVKQGALTATLETETAAARNILLDNLPALRERLAEQDIRIEKFDVDVRRDGGQQSENPATEDRLGNRSQNASPLRRTDEADSSETTEQLSTSLAGFTGATDDGLDIVI